MKKTEEISPAETRKYTICAGQPLENLHLTSTCSTTLLRAVPQVLRTEPYALHATTYALPATPHVLRAEPHALRAAASRIAQMSLQAKSILSSHFP